MESFVTAPDHILQAIRYARASQLALEPIRSEKVRANFKHPKTNPVGMIIHLFLTCK